MKSGYVIAFDTSTDQLACALAYVDVVAEPSGSVAAKPNATLTYRMVGVKDAPAKRRANTTLIPTVEELLKEQNLTARDLVAVVCGKGPGSFTGVRIGVATAKGLALGQNIPLYGISTLDSVAYNAYEQGVRGTLCVLDDAMRKEVYPGLYNLTDTGVTRRFARETVKKVDPALAFVNLHAQRVRESSEQEKLLLTGDALFKYKDTFAQADVEILDESLWYPTGEGIIKAFCATFDPTDQGDPALMLPCYTRLSDAEENERIRLGLREPSTVAVTGVSENLADIHLQLRPMSINDVAQVAKVEEAIFGGLETWTEGMFLEEFSHEDRIWWVAHDQEKIVGYAGAQLIDNDVQLLDVGITASHRNQGLAKRLIARVTYDAMMLGATTSSLEVNEANTAALELYKALGYETVGKRKNYYGTGKNALIMQVKLPLTVDINAQEAENTLPVRPYPHPEPVRTADEQAALADASPLIAAIESSCDETAVALIDKNGEILSNVIATQIDFHARFGGVVPEIASRKHTEAIVGVYEEALAEAARTLGLEDPLTSADLSAIAVTQGPGLVGALVVGLAFAKGIALANNLPLIGVNHLEGHLYANLFETPDLTPPFVASLLSGGHTMLVYVKDWGEYEILGQTLDDAVGEAFDKVAKALGLGYPGGPIISRLAKEGDPTAIEFPRAMLHSHDYRFSLSGLKTAVINYIHNENAAKRPINLPDLAASFEAAVIDVQVAKALAAVQEKGVTDFCVGGGVAANPALRKALVDTFTKHNVRVTLPPLSACTDNAAMIALVARELYTTNSYITFEADSDPNMSLEK